MTMRHTDRKRTAAVAIAAVMATAALGAAAAHEFKWEVHDMNRPQPPVVTPAPLDDPFAAPSDAVVLFDGKNLDAWQSGNGEAAKWKVEDGYFEVVPKTGTLSTKERFGDCQLHIEFATPSQVSGESQGRGNSGVFLMGRYEVQVLDCYDNPTYADGTTGALYGQHPPLANACRKPGEWSRYDIIFRAPRFNDDGSVAEPGYVTVLLNGIVVQNHAELLGSSTHKRRAQYQKHDPTGPIQLQDHGNPMRFRNVWVRPLTDSTVE